MLKYKNKRIVELSDWDELVKTTYNKPYNFQQQNGCQERGSYRIMIPSEYTEDEHMNDSIPEKINGEKMGVKFAIWLERDPKQPVGDIIDDWRIELFWERNFYPDIHTVANDLYEKGLIEKGEYTIDIDW